MTTYRHQLPQLQQRLFLTDGGIETYFVFQEGRALPYFAAFDLLRSGEGKAALAAYYERYIAIARENGAGFILESATWRASMDWADKMGIGAAELAYINREASAPHAARRRRPDCAPSPMTISGCVGPRGDGYQPGALMSVEEAAAYHAAQIRIFSTTEADMISAVTMTNASEAIGVALASSDAGMPCAISFTVETDGALPTGQSVREAIIAVDAATGGAPAYYMLNCAHPSHFEAMLEKGGAWTKRIKGLRCNASAKSHAELDEATSLDAGDAAQLGRDYARLASLTPSLSIFGGCCGTDHTHVAHICREVRDAEGARFAAE
ncbi:MAG: homocysteine S-methyltransferase family protein [Amphiplicatus sp.]